MGSSAKASQAKLFLMVVNSMAVILSLAVIIFGFVILYADIDVAVVSALPTWIFNVIIGFNAMVFLISILGLVAGCGSSKLVAVAFVAVSILLLVVQLLMLVFALLYANGVSTTGSVDGLAKDLQSQLEDTLVEMAVTNPVEWLSTVETFSCCGVDFEANYDYTTYVPDIVDTRADFVETLQVSHSKRNCTEGVEEILWVMDLFPEYSEDAETSAFELPVLGNVEEPYFCKDLISARAQEWTVYIAAIIGVLLLVQILSTVAACYLLCAVTVSQGGFKKDQYGYGDGGPETDGDMQY